MFMKYLLLLSTLLLSTPPSFGQLGSADVSNFEERQIVRTEWDAWCGEKRVECKVKFQNGRLSVDDSEGILPGQVVSIGIFRWCRQRAFGFPNCFLVSADKDYTLKYLDSDGSTRMATFSIKNWEAAPTFYSDLGVWSKKAVHWIPVDSLLGGKADVPDFKKKNSNKRGEYDYDDY